MNANERLNYSIPEAADALGIGKTKLYDLISNEGLPIVKIGKRTLINKRALAEWLESCKVGRCNNG